MTTVSCSEKGRNTGQQADKIDIDAISYSDTELVDQDSHVRVDSQVSEHEKDAIAVNDDREIDDNGDKDISNVQDGDIEVDEEESEEPSGEEDTSDTLEGETDVVIQDTDIAAETYCGNSVVDGQEECEAGMEKDCAVVAGDRYISGVVVCKKCRWRYNGCDLNLNGKYGAGHIDLVVDKVAENRESRDQAVILGKHLFAGEDEQFSDTVLRGC